jgi:RNA polymerase sigma-70 factor (ECF subfamily)
MAAPGSESGINGELGWAAVFRASQEPTALQDEVTQIFRALRDPVYRYLARMLNDPMEAEDLSQEVFLRLFCELRKRGEVKNIRAWLFRVAHNLAADRHREVRLEQRDGRAGTGQDPDRCANDTEEGILKRERQRRMETALSLLSVQERRCLELRAEGLRYREIAEALSIGSSTVETFLARAIRKIVKQLDG